MLWQHYYNGSDALIWIVDSTDVDRMKECRDELHHVCASDSLRHAAVLVYANKQDAPKAERPDVVAGHLGLHTLPQREWYIQPCSALTGDGLVEGLEWLNKTLGARHHRGCAGQAGELAEDTCACTGVKTWACCACAWW